MNETVNLTRRGSRVIQMGSVQLPRLWLLFNAAYFEFYNGGDLIGFPHAEREYFGPELHRPKIDRSIPHACKNDIEHLFNNERKPKRISDIHFDNCAPNCAS
jgi:hypothetical protein